MQEEHVVFFVVDGREFPVSREEAQRVVCELRGGENPFAIAAAVYIERLLDELDANPAMTENEAATLGLALHNVAIQDGSLPNRLEELRLALLSHFGLG